MKKVLFILISFIIILNGCRSYNLKVDYDASSDFAPSTPLKVNTPETVIEGDVSTSPDLKKRDIRLRDNLKEALTSRGFNVVNGSTEYEFNFSADNIGLMSEFSGAIVDTLMGYEIISVSFEQDTEFSKLSHGEILKKIADKIYEKIVSSEFR